MTTVIHNGVPVGKDIFLTREAFYTAWPQIRIHDRETKVPEMAFEPGYTIEHWTYGLFDPKTKNIYVVCADPKYPTPTNMAFYIHEMGHRLDDTEHLIEGYSSPWPLLLEIPGGRIALTHPEVNVALRMRGYKNVP